ncbi:Thiol-disulfide oxidoreductase ResA [subsurface metagenome]
MSEQKKQTRLWPVLSVSVIILAAVVIWRATIFKPAPQTQTEHQHQHSPFESFAESTGDANQPKVSLNNVIKAARTWGPAYTYWYGKMAPDFTLTDIDGKQHKLSDYRGKNVMIIFWATWCRPCLIEMPHLITLRNIINEDKLAMLAISNENPVLVRNFATDRKINYTVLSDTGTMPAPYNQIRGIPCSFFIEPNGKIKLATEGMLSLGEMKAILQADSKTQ